MDKEDKEDKAQTARKVQFTQAWIDKIEPLATTTVYYDEKISGLALRVTASGIKSFFVRRWSGGSAKRVQLGRYKANAATIDKLDGSAATTASKLEVLNENPLLSLVQARRLAEAVIANIDLAKEKTPKSLTLGAMFEEYMSRHMDKSRKTSAATRKEFERDLGKWSNRKLSEISHSDCETLHAKLGKERGPYTANRRIQLLKAIYGRADSWQIYKGENPCKGITLFKETPRNRALSTEESKRLWKVLEKEPPGVMRDYFKMLRLNGIRGGNVKEMRWSEIDWVAQTWTIPDTKSGEAQVVALTEAELSILQERYFWRQNSDFVFPSKRSKTGHMVTPDKAWKRVKKAAGIDDTRQHDLRHTVTSDMANSGTGPAIVSSTVGHKDIKTTLRVYTHTAKGVERNAKALAHHQWLPVESLAESLN